MIPLLLVFTWAVVVDLRLTVMLDRVVEVEVQVLVETLQAKGELVEKAEQVVQVRKVLTV